MTYGAADFLGGLAARRANTVAAAAISQTSGLIALIAVIPFLPRASPGVPDLVWGGVAGLAVGAGIGLLYRALAVGAMTVVAPATAVCAVVIPLVAAVLLGERPGPRALTGIAVAIVSIVLVSQQRTDAPSARRGRSGLGLALLAGVGIGLFFIALARTSSAAGLWPLLVARVASVALFGIGAIAIGRSLRMAAPTAALAVASGVLDMTANALYLLATYNGPLSVVATLTSLYPASTVLLALVVLRERLTVLQGAGIAGALLAVWLIVGR